MTTLSAIAAWGIWKHWRLLLVLAGIIVLIGIVIGTYRSCQRAKLRIDQEQINKINSGNRREREKELRDLVEENADVLNRVDERGNLADTNVVERNREIDAKVRDASQKVEQARQSLGRDVTQEELQCILVPTDCPSQ